MSDLIDRQAAIDAIRDMQAFEDDNGCSYLYLDDVMAVFTDEEELPSAQPKNENLKFLEFLWNTINPNEMEQYLEMYSSKEVKSNG